jgi:tetratricopeptide (TPR) repeat protein
MDDTSKLLQAYSAKMELAEALNAKGAALSQQGDLGNSLKAYQESEAIFNKLNSDMRVLEQQGSEWKDGKSLFNAGIAKAKGNQAPVLFQQGKYKEAFTCLRQAQKIALDAKEFDIVGLFLRNEGILLERRGHLEEALVPLRKAEKVFRRIGDAAGLAETLLVQYKIVDWEEGPEKADCIGKEALQIAESNGLTELAVRIRRRIESVEKDRGPEGDGDVFLFEE